MRAGRPASPPARSARRAYAAGPRSAKRARPPRHPSGGRPDGPEVALGMAVVRLLLRAGVVVPVVVTVVVVVIGAAVRVLVGRRAHQAEQLRQLLLDAVDVLVVLDDQAD